MNIRFIRNATIRLNYSGRTLLIDPFLAPKHTLPSFAGRSPNPLVDLPIPAHEVIEGIDHTLISHLHSDHFDPAAQELLRKDMPILCQPDDEDVIRGKGFGQVTPIENQIEWQGIAFHRTAGRHGSSAAVLADMGNVMGFVLQAAGEPTLYWAGDTVLYAAVEETIVRFQPDVIVTHSGGAVWGDDELIIMDAAQTIAVCELAPHSTVIATHLEALDHCLSSRADLRLAAESAGIPRERLLIPADGDTLAL